MESLPKKRTLNDLVRGHQNKRKNTIAVQRESSILLRASLDYIFLCDWCCTVADTKKKAWKHEARCHADYMIRQQQQHVSSRRKHCNKIEQMKCGVPAHRHIDPHAPTHTHTKKSAHRTDTHISNVHARRVVVNTSLLYDDCCCTVAATSRGLDTLRHTVWYRHDAAAAAVTAVV